MVYILSPENCVTYAIHTPPLYESWGSPVAAILSISTDQTVLDAIKCGYAVDEYCQKITNSTIAGTKCVNGLWYIGDCLLIPHIGNI